jgi:hypothetical protein
MGRWGDGKEKEGSREDGNSLTKKPGMIKFLSGSVETG